MALTKLTFKPGINKDITNYSQEGGWYDGDKIRFRQGFPEKIGGWEVQNFTQYQGSARSLFSYSTLLGDQIFGIGTNLKMYVFAGTSIYDITPITTAVTLTACFGTSSGSVRVCCSDTAHNRSVGDYVFFTSTSAIGSSNSPNLDSSPIILANIPSKKSVNEAITNNTHAVKSP